MIVDHGVATAELGTPPAGAPAVPATTPSLAWRCGWSLAWFGILSAGIGLWASWNTWPGAAWAAPALVLVGIVGTASVWVVRGTLAGVQGWVCWAIATVAVASPQAAAIHVRQFYVTDSAAFNQVATRLLLHGKNPYTASLASAADLLKVPSSYWTYLVDGRHVSTVSYPAGSFLAQVPFMALGFHHAIVDWTDLGAWLVAGLLLMVMLPARLRWLAVTLVLAGQFTGLFSNGGTDAVFIPLLLVAVWQWDRFATGNAAGLARWVGPVALGLACAVKQTPWFCVPFLVIGVAIEAHRGGRRPWPVIGSYAALVAVAFAAVNLPFIVWNPSAWFHGTVLPLTQPLVADGQGLVTVALHGLSGGVDLTLLTLAGALAYLALLVAFVLRYSAMKRIWLFLLAGVLFMPGRSLTTYLVDLFPIALVGAIAVSPAAPPRPPAWLVRWRRYPWRRWAAPAAIAAPLAAVVAVSAAAFTSAPLQLTVRSVRTANATQQLTSVTVTVHNGTDHQVTPHFMVVIQSAHPDGYWSPSTPGGHVVLAAGASATVTLRPPSYTWSPDHGAYWLVEAYTASPDALSTSPLQHWTLGQIPLPKRW